MTDIEWTWRPGTKGETWNPTTGCDRISAGCDNCYAMTMAKRLKGMGSAKYQNDGDPRTSGPGFGVAVHPDTLGAPLRWRTPRTVFVNSMSDLFHDQVPDEYIARVFAVMAVTPQHTYQILTKRHGRMRSLLRSHRWWTQFSAEAAEVRQPGQPVSYDADGPHLRNVWLGVSVEDQKRADLRIPALLDTPAAVRFLSCEPLLGPVNLQRIGRIDSPDGVGIDWVICGGESGPGARPMHPDWVRALRDQCSAADVPFFFKQWGAFGLLPKVGANGAYIRDGGVTVANDGTVYQPGDLSWPDGPRTGEAIRAGHDKANLHAMYRVGKGAAGRELDGRTWDEYPQAVARD